MIAQYHWCFSCERAFDPKKVYGTVVAEPGDRGGFSCPLCGVDAIKTIDWQSFIFGVAASNNYPEEPEDGKYYPLYPVE